MAGNRSLDREGLQVETNSNPVRVLVIEDNPADVELLRMALDDARLSCELTVLDDGGSALAAFSDARSTLRVDLIVLDLNLPKYDGLELLDAARRGGRFTSVPIAVLSSSSSPREQARIEEYGRVTYMTKPTELDEYLSIGSKLREFLFSTRQCVAGGLGMN